MPDDPTATAAPTSPLDPAAATRAIARALHRTWCSSGTCGGYGDADMRVAAASVQFVREVRGE